MTKPTAAQSREMAELEDHIATVSETLSILRLGLDNARRSRDWRTTRAIDDKIRYFIRRMAELRARRDALARELGANEGR